MSWRVIQADALEGPRSLPGESVQCCVTSPPFWGLRDYGVEGQLGLEPTPEEYVARMVDIFREVRRVLRGDGVCWLNLGDSYSRDPKRGDQEAGGHAGLHAGRSAAGAMQARASYRADSAAVVPGTRNGGGLPEKNLIGIPWRVAFALQADGWYLRSDVIWNKPNPMPESVRDRPTKAHEYLFLLTKSPRYFWDQEAVREESCGAPDLPRHHGDGQALGEKSGKGGCRVGSTNNGRNIRSVWTITTQPFPEAHFATFPPELPRRCILAGTSEAGACPECGAPMERIVDRERTFDGEPQPNAGAWARSEDPRRLPADGKGHWRWAARSQTIGWSATCVCPVMYGDVDSKPAIPCIVLDPFAGSGTTGMVARQLGRHFIGIELSPEYAAMAERRIGEACVETILGEGGKMAAILGPLFEGLES